MGLDGYNVDADTIKTYSVDAVAHWLCEVGFRDFTARFIERNVDGNAILNLKEFQVKNYIHGDKLKEREFWNLLQRVRNQKFVPTNRQQGRSTESSTDRNMFRKGPNPQIGRPGMMPPRNAGPPLPHQSRPPQPHPGQNNYNQPAFRRDDSFDDDFSEDEYEEDIESYPNQWNRPAAPSGPVGTPGIRGQPAPPPRPGPRPAGDAAIGPAQDSEEDYLTFETPEPQHNPGPPYHLAGFAPKSRDRPLLPTPISMPSSDPPVPPRSPMRGSNYHDHVLPGRSDLPPDRSPMRGSNYHDHVLPGRSDLPPDRPPPRPPGPGHPPMPTHQPGWPPMPRKGSGKDSLGNSPASSREPSLKNDHMSHMPSRSHNLSTGSSSSTSSEDTQQPPPAKGNFRPMKQPQFGSGFRPQMHSNVGLKAMPPIPSASPPKAQATSTEDQPWYRNQGRHAAQEEVTTCGELGCFVVRPRDSPAKPYALTLWANDKIYNFIIRKREDGEYALGTEKTGERTFVTVMKLIEYYQQFDLILAENEGVVKLSGPPN